HYTGKNDAAIEQFERILAEAADPIDAYWGIALSYRKAGNKEKSLEAFQQAADLIAIAAQTDAEHKERYFMLQRMVKQQIEQMADFI
ncbi:MAG: tetratricopeptide repeat protein, partial [Anaerolineae bacterium]|nr:tetratricopeptide repeat protein [Anaerolineae bacterium]